MSHVRQTVSARKVLASTAHATVLPDLGSIIQHLILVKLLLLGYSYSHLPEHKCHQGPVRGEAREWGTSSVHLSQCPSQGGTQAPNGCRCPLHIQCRPTSRDPVTLGVDLPDTYHVDPRYTCMSTQLFTRVTFICLKVEQCTPLTVLCLHRVRLRPAPKLGLPGLPKGECLTGCTRACVQCV